MGHPQQKFRVHGDTAISLFTPEALWTLCPVSAMQEGRVVPPKTCLASLCPYSCSPNTAGWDPHLSGRGELLQLPQGCIHPTWDLGR